MTTMNHSSDTETERLSDGNTRTSTLSDADGDAANAIDVLQQSTPLRYRVSSRVSSRNQTPYNISSSTSTPRHHSLALALGHSSKLPFSSSATETATFLNHLHSYRLSHHTATQYQNTMKQNSFTLTSWTSPLTVSQRDLLNDSSAATDDATPTPTPHNSHHSIDKSDKKNTVASSNNGTINNTSSSLPKTFTTPVPTTVKKLKLLHDKQRIQAHKNRIQRTMIQLSNYLIIILLSVVTFYIYTMISPVLSTIFYAAMIAHSMHTSQLCVLHLFQWMDHYWNTMTAYSKILVVSVSMTICISMIYSMGGANSLSSMCTLMSVTILSLLAVILLCGNRHTITSIILILTLVTVVAIPMLLMINTVTHETQRLIIRINSFVTENYHFDHLLNSLIQHPFYHSVTHHAMMYNIQLPSFNEMKLSIIQMISRISGMTSNYMLTYALSTVYVNGSYISLQVMIFFSSVYYFLQYQCITSSSSPSSSFHDHIIELSPFSPDDNHKIIQSLKRSLYRTILASLSIGASHTAITYVSLYVVGISECLILSIMAGFLSMMPIVSSWLILLPIIIQLYITSYIYSALFILAVQLVVLLYIDPLVYSLIPGNLYITSLSLVCGIYTFGVTGIVSGPTLAAVALTLIEIYKEYNSMPISSLKNVNTLGQPIIDNGVSVSESMEFSSPLKNVVELNTITPLVSKKTMIRQDTPFQSPDATTALTASSFKQQQHHQFSTPLISYKASHRDLPPASPADVPVNSLKQKPERKRKLVMASQPVNNHSASRRVTQVNTHTPHRSNANIHDISEQSDTDSSVDNIIDDTPSNEDVFSPHVDVNSRGMSVNKSATDVSLVFQTGEESVDHESHNSDDIDGAKNDQTAELGTGVSIVG